MSIVKPSKLPNTNVMMDIGIKDIGSCQAIINELGISVKKEIRIPFKTGFIFKSTEAMKKPIIIHIDKAEKFASQVKP